jgi:bifunctional DNA-binding transcriptional regulator/antitoxin component of YhaV-PrlF toxin-antitoxin module
MIPTTTLDEGGGFILPASVRKKLGWPPGAKLAVELEGMKIVMRLRDQKRAKAGEPNPIRRTGK